MTQEFCNVCHQALTGSEKPSWWWIHRKAQNTNTGIIYLFVFPQDETSYFQNGQAQQDSNGSIDDQSSNTGRTEFKTTWTEQLLFPGQTSIFSV